MCYNILLPPNIGNGGDKVNVILYSTGCPNCKMLEKLLDKKNIPYTVNNNVDEMIAKGFMSAPNLEVDGKIMKFGEAAEWVAQYERN